MCEADPTAPRCETTISRVCGRDSLDVLCAGNETYYPSQYTACERNNTNPRCALTISRVCNANVLDGLCKELETYFTMQKTACEGEPNSKRCKATYARICRNDIFNPYCADAEAHYPAQKTACRSELNSERCKAIITRACGASPRDRLCNGLKTNAQVCTDTPFNTACQKNNLTRYDFNEIMGSVAYIESGFRYIESGSSGGDCQDSRYRSGFYCFARVPYPYADIKPLNDTNTGTATYTGDLTIAYHNNDYSNAELAAPNYEYEHAEQTTNINLIVNFGDNSLSYSGTIASNAFSINGNFTDRGHITGTANFRDTEALLRGLIGQTEMIGGFATGFNDKAFAGGFTATRE